MTPAQRKQIEKLLRDLLLEVSGKGPLKIEPNRTSVDEVGDNQDEQPLNEMMQSIASNRNKNSAFVLAKVQKALTKLSEDPDEFGICESCDEEILFGRLKALPYAEQCTACQSKQDAPGRATRKKLTDYQ